MTDPDDLLSAALDKHANLIGHVTIAWNMAQSLVFVLFGTLSRLSLEEASAVFFNIKTDSGQRDITRELGKVVLASDKQLAAEFASVMHELQTLSGERNAAIHTMWSVLTLENKVTPSTFAPVHKSLDPNRTAEQFSELSTKIGNVTSRLVPMLVRIAQHVASQKKSREQQENASSKPQADGR